MIVTTPQAYKSTRPEDHGERTRCLEFVAVLREAGLGVDLTTSLALVGAATETYVSARKANQTAASIAEKRSDAARGAATGFDAAFNHWTFRMDAVRDEKGYAAAHLKGQLDGANFSDFLRKSDWDKVARMVTLFVHVSENPDLVGDPAAYAALRKATDTLRDALGARDDADRDVKDASDALKAATKVFDRKYGKLISDLEICAHDQWETAPRFRRERKVKVQAPDDGSSSGGSEDGAGEDPTPPTPDEGVPDADATPADEAPSEAAK